MDLSRQEYPTLLASLLPTQAVNVLNDRVRLITSVNASIADWLQERRRVEEAYIQGLTKLAKRPTFQDGSASLGIFQMPWQRIVSGTESLAQSHQLLATQIETDVETPLRQFATTNREMQSMSTIQGNLASLAKDLDKAQSKADKLKDKSGRTSADKVANINSSVDDASQQWESQAPYVFEQLQSLDETRVNHLRDLLTQFQTHEVDQVERNRTNAESCLNSLLNLETADEIKTFAASVSGNRASLQRRRSSATASARPQSSSMPPPPTPPPPRTAHGRDGGYLGTPGGQDRLPPVDEKPAKRSGFGGIKRLGTVINRRKSNIPPVPTSEKKKEWTRSFAPFRRGDSTRSFQDLESPSAGRGLTPVASQNSENASQHTQFRSGINEQARIGEPSVVPTPPLANGTYATETVADRTTSQPPNHITHELNAAPSSPVQRYQTPPSSIDPISQAQQESAIANAESEDTLRNLTIRDQPIPEDEVQAKQAMNDMASQLRMQAQTSGQGRMASVRGRRDVRNTMFVPNPIEPANARDLSNISTTAAISAAAVAAVPGTADLASPIKRAGTPGTIPEDHAVSDSTSIHSSHSLVGLAQHPELHNPGLNASIIETVSTWFSEGQIIKSFVVGEIALAYNATSDFPGPNIDTIRLENFQHLEKVAANPAFVTPVVSQKSKEPAGAEDRSGEYSINLSPIKRAAPTVALKYQLHLDPEHLSTYSPVLFTPAWQIHDTQASVIIIYAINPTFTRSSSTITLKNMVITVTLDTTADSGKATSAMMSPTTGASFKRKQSLVVWRLPELVIDPEQKKLLARFITTGPPPKAGNVEARWELPGDIGSGLDVSMLVGESSDPFADETATATRSWNTVPSMKKLISGRYSVA